MPIKVEAIQPLFESGLKPLAAKGPNILVSNPQEVITINTAFSISEKGLPARFLAGFIPAILISQLVAEQHEASPTLRMFVPLNLGVFCNEINLSRGTEVVSLGRKVIARFIENFHPTTRWVVDFDKPWTPEATQALTDLWELMHDRNDAELGQIKAQNAESAARHGNGHSSDRTEIYAAHHVFGWQDCQSELFFAKADPSPTAVINVMSASEKRFQKIRDRIRTKASTTHPTLMMDGKHMDLITARCPGPHYLRSGDAPNLEPTLEELIADGFIQIARRLHDMRNGNDKFKTAFLDLWLVKEHMDQLNKANPNLPTIDEFLMGLK